MDMKERFNQNALDIGNLQARTRRHFLGQSVAGLGGFALGNLLSEGAQASKLMTDPLSP